MVRHLCTNNAEVCIATEIVLLLKLNVAGFAAAFAVVAADAAAMAFYQLESTYGRDTATTEGLTTLLGDQGCVVI